MSESSASPPSPDWAVVFDQLPTAYLVLSPDFEILTANEAYLKVLSRSRADLVGRFVFDAFPPTPDSLDEHGRNPVELSFQRARDTGRIDQMPLVKYEIADPVTGTVEQRYWSLISAPVLDDGGRTAVLLQRVEDVTAYVHERRLEQEHREQDDDWRRRVELVEAELFTRAQELRTALAAQETASRRLAGLAEAALQLAVAETVEDLAEVVVSSGLAALGADGGAIAVRDDARSIVRLTITDSLGEGARSRYAELPLDNPLPAPWAARTGEPVLLPDREACLAWSTEMAEVYAVTGRAAWAALPLRSGDRLLGSLITSWRESHSFDPEEVDLLAAFSAQCAQALDRLQVRQAEQQAAAQSRQMSETLQRSMLTEPPEPDHLQIVVRYRAAAEQVQVGGDWYDAFLGSDGATCIVVGDVTGHDRQAAAVMGQIRNLLRGIAYTLDQPPAAVLRAVDMAMRDLDVGALATALLARVEQTEQQSAAGVRLLRWSNAGHLPPVLLRADGSTSLLAYEPDLLLGVNADAPRADHAQELSPNDTVLLFTDGLVERRDRSLDDGLDWLLAAVRERAALEPDDLCDSLLAEVTATAEDDIAMLLLRAHPEDRPRPAKAGRRRVPGAFRDGEPPVRLSSADLARR